jgi:DHA1 family tetracycline resistance protein-like MFS transporter
MRSSAQTPKKPFNFRNLDRRLLTILLIVFVQMLGTAMILPILPLYAKREFAMSDQVIPLLISAYFVAQFIAGPYLGRLSDNYGRIPVLIISQLGTAVSFAMLAWAPNVEVLFLARILDGITGGNIIVAQAYITDVTPREERTKSLGYIFAVFGLGFIFGPALGGILSAALGPRLPYLIAAVAALITTGITWLALDETITKEEQSARRQTKQPGIAFRQIVTNQPLFLVLIVAFVGQFGVGLLRATYALFGEAVLFNGYDENTTNLGIGLLLSVVGLGQFFTQMLLLGRMVKRFGEAQLVIIGDIVRALGFLVLALALTPLVGAVASLLFAMGTGLMMPPLQSLATRTVDDRMRGGVLGVYQSSISLAIIVSTAIAGFIYAVLPALPFWFGFGLGMLILIPAFMLLRQFPKTHTADPAGLSASPTPEKEATPAGN